MSTKPTSLPRFAETAGGTPAANITEPASGQKDTGWTNSQAPPSSYFNWYMQLVYKWTEYLRDGALSGNHSIVGDLAITGTVTITGNATVSGTFGSTGLITATAGLTAAANQHVIVSGTGRFKHGTMEEWISPADFGEYGGGTPIPSGQSAAFNPIRKATGGGQTAVALIKLPVGARLQGVTLYHKRAGGSIHFQCHKHTITSDTKTNISDFMTISAGTTLVGTAATNFVATTVATGTTFYVYMDSGATADEFHGVMYTYDFP